MCSREDEYLLLQRGLKVLQENVVLEETAGNRCLPVIGEPLTEDSRGAVIHRIERIVLDLLQQLAAAGPPGRVHLLVPRHSQWDTMAEDQGRAGQQVPGLRGRGLVSKLRFDVPSSQRKFAILVLLLSRVHTLLSTRSSGTRRQLYYEEVAFLRSQREVDEGALGVSRVLGLPPWHLGLLATAKGLVAGDLALSLNDGEVLDCRHKPGGVLIPGDVSAIERVESAARFILVLEKDTIFQRVLQEGILDRLGPCIVVTGKGYPDVSTRVLLARLEAELQLPMLAVVDADPYGVHIMCVYRFGTKTCPLPLRSMRWLGVLPSELSSLGVRGVPLTDRDESLARSLLDERQQQQRRLPNAVRQEVETILSLGMKAEVDALIEFAPCYLTDAYLPNKIAAANVL
ncbi:hypothetical protein ONE63_009088 [Megalurothrips usitatus]|uniref:DNA topoisomerase (ATP-hydrolyzing) n=1 Tax=Megalurothrips usitatus TaxID=439358 RepID=A0AAV7XQ74_9NEOP|nr:hypothetical protein ONE63_009088 [Megalurothrips usitatus]